MKYWREDVEKARAEAKAGHKLLVLEYDASLDADLCSAMTPAEFDKAKATQYDNSHAGWIAVKEDYTQKCMKEYVFEELGYFTESQCKAIKKCLQGESMMDFDITWSSYVGNCTLIVRTDYQVENPQEIKNFFLHCALGKLLDLQRR